MSKYHARMSGRARQRRNHAILAASDVCHLCGHQGADAIDHIIPISSAKDDAELARLEHASNLRPAHHDVPCPTCGERCNRAKGDKLIAPIIRRSGSLNRP